MATDQRLANRRDYMSTEKEDNYAYGMHYEQQKAR